MTTLKLLAGALVCSAASMAPHPYSGLKGRPAARALPRSSAAAGRLAALSPASASSSWCAPGQACWPSASDWAALNASVGGSLLAVAPPLAPCFGFPGVPIDMPACQTVVSNYTNSYFRASQVGATQEINWEQDATSGADCFNPLAPCALGNIPPYAVRVRSAADVSAALCFAAQHTLRVVIKSSGHEYQGRSSGINGLLIWTHALKAAAIDLNYTTGCAGHASGPAATAAPGSSWGEVYAAADASRVTVVGGSEISVSACGGYTMGGGHSWMGPAFGMAVDNALRFEVVLANGSAVVASACEHTDLFWALRGGGGGTFGVVTACTYAAHPFPAAGAAGAFITVELLRGQQSLALLLDGFLDFALALGDANASGGVVAGGYFLPVLDAPEGTHEHVSFSLGFNGTVDQANAALAPLAAWAETQPQDLSIIGAQVVPFASLMAFHESFDDSSEATGYAGTLGSRLIPAATLRNDTARAAVAETLASITFITGGLTGMLVAGGAVAAADPGSLETSLNGAWRRAGVHIAYGASWQSNATLAEQQAIFEGVSALTDPLRALTPGSGAYWSESDFYEPAWQDAFYGDSYARLQSIKRAVDPTGLFSCHHCVELPAAAAAEL